MRTRESQAGTMLKGEAARLEHYPQLRARIQRHVQETRNQGELVGECLELAGESPSPRKDTGGYWRWANRRPAWRHGRTGDGGAEAKR